MLWTNHLWSWGEFLLGWWLISVVGQKGVVSGMSLSIGNMFDLNVLNILDYMGHCY